MTSFILRRLAQLIPVLLIASFAIWGMIFAVPGGPVGMVLSPDGTRMFVTHMQSWSGSIDEISIPDKTLTHHTTFEVVGMPVGMVFDGANRVLYERSLHNHAVIDMIDVQ